MKNNSNDTKILELKKKIEEKKAEISYDNFKPKTNCVAELNGIKYNLNVMNEESLILFLAMLNSIKMSLNDLVKNKYVKNDNVTICGFELNSWIEDTKNKLKIKSMKEEERKLKSLEEQLVQLLSQDTKTKLEVEKIESLLG